MIDSPPLLDVSLVTYHPDPVVVGATLAALARAVSRLRAERPGAAVRLVLVDNDEVPRAAETAALLDGLAEPVRAAGAEVAILSGHGNVGYGRGHDLALLAEQPPAPWHLVLNPDVEMADDALLRGIAHLEAHPGVVLVAPRVEGADGAYQYLCKRRPGLTTLALRGFAPSWLRAPFRGLLARYEMRDVLGPQVSEPVSGIPIASGCFMLLRTEAVRAVGGFGDAYFLYFEDFDLCLRLGRQGDLVYLPTMRIVHLGGHAGRKGSHHRKLFLRSALTFFRRNGWRLG